MDQREIGWGEMYWIDLAQVPVDDSCEHGNAPSGMLGNSLVAAQLAASHTKQAFLRLMKKSFSTSFKICNRTEMHSEPQVHAKGLKHD
jgi:hypothetical protein